MRFFGSGAQGVDRAVINMSTSTLVNVGSSDFTIEFWVKGTLANNNSAACASAPGVENSWVTGNRLIDRGTVSGPGYGVSLKAGHVAFGVGPAAAVTLCGSTNVLDGVWHHVALTRAAQSGQLQIFVDGVLDGTMASSPGQGDISFESNATAPASDQVIVIGAEKTEFSAMFLTLPASTLRGFNGWLDEIRFSSILRYNASFTKPTRRFSRDASTAALYRLDEGNGTRLTDAGNTSHGQVQVGGANAGPQWSTDKIF
jgi:hypothetical protein